MREGPCRIGAAEALSAKRNPPSRQPGKGGSGFSGSGGSSRSAGRAPLGPCRCFRSLPSRLDRPLPA
jgi:hypothetical protein